MGYDADMKGHARFVRDKDGKRKTGCESTKLRV
jgi:hypothetical protein